MHLASSSATGILKGMHRHSPIAQGLLTVLHCFKCTPDAMKGLLTCCNFVFRPGRHCCCLCYAAPGRRRRAARAGCYSRAAAAARQTLLLQTLQPTLTRAPRPRAAHGPCCRRGLTVGFTAAGLPGSLLSAVLNPSPDSRSRSFASVSVVDLLQREWATQRALEPRTHLHHLQGFRVCTCTCRPLEVPLLEDIITNRSEQ